MREATLATAHDFTLDELQAYDEGTLAPDRAAVVAAHLAAGCAACRAWIATSHEVGRLLHADAGAHLDGPDAFLRDTPSTHARRWLRRRLRPRRFMVLLVVLPLKARLVRHLFRTQQGWEPRASAALSLLALTVATLRFVFARPSWPTPSASAPTTRGAAAQGHGAAAHGHGDRSAGRGRR
jgi:anti-sigma factor RsiW